MPSFFIFVLWIPLESRILIPMSEVVFAQIFPPFTLCKKQAASLKILLKGGSPAIEQSPGPHSDRVKG
jgi:hypothetical protein